VHPDWPAPTTTGGETGLLAQGVDWAATPLGPAETWPEGLRAAVSICFSTRFPVMIAWGPELTMIYNDGYRAMLGAQKHPAAMAAAAAQLWAEVWPDVGPSFDHVLSTGEPTWVVDQPLLMERSGFLEETWFTYSYSPLRDADGTVAGVLDIAYETTGQVVDRRRLAAVTDLTSCLQGITTPEELTTLTLECLEEAADVGAASLHLPVDGRVALVGSTPGAAPAPAHVLEQVRRSLEPVDLPSGGVVVPLAGDHHAAEVGAVVLEGNPRRPFDAEHRAFLLLIAQTIGTALRSTLRLRQRVQESRRIGDALQAAMLPVVPSGPRLQTRYRPADGNLTVGGDWYDVVDLGSGRRALVVGDCVGHGLGAAAVMGQLRSAGRALLLEDSSPASTLEGLDRFAATLPGAACTTVFCGIVDEATGEITYSSAGHPPPLVAGSRGLRWLDDARARPLTLRSGARPEATAQLDAGDALLLYTDGLVERRGEPLRQGLARLREAAADLGAAGLDEAVVDRLLTTLIPDGASDDVALLLYRVVA
jgi:serine phosphatase RsbU (regulator of sigma subunit)